MLIAQPVGRPKTLPQNYHTQSGIIRELMTTRSIGGSKALKIDFSVIYQDRIQCFYDMCSSTEGLRDHKHNGSNYKAHKTDLM